ncbi:arylsulfatase [Flagellimonas sp. 2504JD4-2]
MKPILISAILVSCIIHLGCNIQQNEKVAEKENFGQSPNIIFILTDDQGYGDLGRHGNPVLKTPNIDRLYDESVRFTDFMVSPTCAPSRAAIFSGMHEFKSGVTHTLDERSKMDLNVVTLTDILSATGYKTGLFGKWHLGLDSLYRPENRGFDVALTGKVGMDYRIYNNPILYRNGLPEKHKGYRTNILFDEAIKFITANKEKPFFCHIPTYSPHDPLDVPTKYSDRYNGNKFFGMVSCIDDNIGKLMDTLIELGLDKNTLVILINDNGATFGSDIWNANRRGVKTTAWEGGTKAFSFWRWPGTLVPKDVDVLTAHVDILPTLAEIVRADIPDGTKAKLDGKSLVPLLKYGNWQSEDRFVFTHVGRWNKGTIDAHKYCQVAVRSNNYSLVRMESCNSSECRAECSVLDKVEAGGEGYYSKINAGFNYKLTSEGKWELYDVKNDISQEHNIAKDYPNIVNEMSQAYEKWWESVYDGIK